MSRSSAEATDTGGCDHELDALVDHCLEARAIIADRGTPVMRRLIDLLLFEVGSEIGGIVDGTRVTRDLG